MTIGTPITSARTFDAFIERYGNRYRSHSATLRFLGTRRSLKPMKVGSEENNS
ncbi:MAG: hypothetical protein ND866_28600 [Pyrinomonadaceae bacterium]|nr:hypothetical protein [Pyrinomonadaceae bacterium]